MTQFLINLAFQYYSSNYNIKIKIQMAEQKTKQYLQAKDKKRTRFTQYPIKDQVISLLHQNRYTKPTLVQAESLPITLQQNLRDLCVIIYAYNGAGKTLTYLIPILNSLQMIPDKGQNQGAKGQQKDINRPQAIIILPTQALMAQVHDYLQGYANYYESRYKWKLNIGLCYSGGNTSGHIIVGMAQKISQYINLPTTDFSQLKWVVFDQCDKIQHDLKEKFQFILKSFSKNDQVSAANFLITSATGDKAKFREFIQQNLVSHNVLELDSKDQNKGLVGVTHYYSISPNKDKVIFNILQKLSKLEYKLQVIIFFNQRKQLWNFYQLLKQQQNMFVINDSQADTKGKHNISVDYVHGRCGNCMGAHNCPQDCRSTKTERVNRLRNQQIQVLLGTQTIGRGIDIRTVSLVINYSSPKNGQQYSPSTYIHRVGRTGRYTDEGIALTFVQDDIFIKVTEQQQKITFIPMKNEQQIIDEAINCSKRNQKITQDSKLRHQNQ